MLVHSRGTGNKVDSMVRLETGPTNTTRDPEYP